MPPTPRVLAHPKSAQPYGVLMDLRGAHFEALVGSIFGSICLELLGAVLGLELTPRWPKGWTNVALRSSIEVSMPRCLGHCGPCKGGTPKSPRPDPRCSTPSGAAAVFTRSVFNPPQHSLSAMRRVRQTDAVRCKLDVKVLYL